MFTRFLKKLLSNFADDVGSNSTKFVSESDRSGQTLRKLVRSDVSRFGSGFPEPSKLKSLRLNVKH